MYWKNARKFIVILRMSFVWAFITEISLKWPFYKYDSMI